MKLQESNSNLKQDELEFELLIALSSREAAGDRHSALIALRNGKGGGELRLATAI